jgi:hypothetical protein
MDWRQLSPWSQPWADDFKDRASTTKVPRNNKLLPAAAPENLNAGLGGVQVTDETVRS